MGLLSLRNRFWSLDAAYRKLDRLAIEAGTDKSSLHHDYMRIYASHLHERRRKAFNFLEIGVKFGYSIHLWESYLRKAHLHFIDIDLSYLIYKPKRAQLHRADQEDEAQLKKVMESIQGGLDIVIDDGGHTMQQQRVSFETLFPYVNPAGLYIIEDLQTSYSNAYGGNTSESMVEYLKRKVDDLNQKRDLEIASLTFYPKLAVVEKRSSSKT